MDELQVSVVTEEMVTRAYAVFMRNVTAVTPKRGDVGEGEYIQPRTAIRKALEAALDHPDLDGAVAELHRQLDGTITAEIRIPARQPERM